MTRIDFYTRVEDKYGTACRLATKALQQRLRVLVCCPDTESARRLDRMLWITPATGFVPHCLADDPRAAVTPVVLDAAGADPLHDEVLVNLRDDWPQHFSRFQRLIEIVSIDADDAQRGRERYRFYRDRGYEIHTHDLSKGASERAAGG